MNKKLKKELFERMVMIRMVEETIAERYDNEKMRCPTHLSTGQEAVSAAVGIALRDDDYAVSTHRSHGHYLGKGGSIPKMIAEIYGKETGCSKGRGGSMHLIDLDVGFMGSTAIVGNTMPIGAGLGLAIQLNNSDNVSCIFLGDGATEEGVFSETINFCALKNLPVLFICENNFYSVYSPLSVRQPKNRSVTEIVEAMGIPASTGDGNDVYDSYKRTKKAISEIRNSQGPKFLEFETYRWREHCGPNFDNHIGYRTEEEFLSWKDKDPIVLAEQYCLKNGVLNKNDIKTITASTTKQVEEAFNFAEESPYPDSNDALKYIYAENLN